MASCCTIIKGIGLEAAAVRSVLARRAGSSAGKLSCSARRLYDRMLSVVSAETNVHSRENRSQEFL